MERKILSKLLVAIIIVTLTATDFLMLGTALVSYAADLSQTTNNNNIEFSTYFKNAEGNKVDTIKEDINKEDLKLYAKVAVKNEGYFNGTLELLEGNFVFKNTEISKGISKIEGNKITLNQINAGDSVEIEIGIAPIKSEEMVLSQLTMASKLKLTGTYMETTYKGKDIKSEKTVNLNLVVDEQNTSAEISNEIVTNKVYNVNGENKRIVQMLVKTNITNNNYPVKQTTLTAEVPEANKEKLEKIEVVALRTKATNGIENNPVIAESSAKDGENVKNVQLKIENNGEKISWKRGANDEFVVTYIYNENANVTGTKLKINTEIEVYNSSNKFSKESTLNVSEQEISNIIATEIDLDQTETYKGQLYANAKTNNKKEISFNTTTKMLVRIAGVAETVKIKEAKDLFTGAELDANTKYIKTYVNKNKMISILGEQGYVEILAGGTSYRLTKDSEVDENGNIVIGYETGIREIEITTSKPINVGVLELHHEKAIMANNYSTEQIKAITGIKSENTLTVQAKLKTNTGNEEKITEITSENGSKAEKILKETYSKAELTVNKANLSTMTENNGVVLGVRFITNGTQYDLYKNPTVKIQLPTEIKDVDVIEIDKLYGDEFTVSKAVYNKADKTIEIELNGEQKAYAENEATQLYLQINLNIVLEQTSASKTEKITMTYTNANASQYEGSQNIEKEIGISAPSGIITINNLNTYNINSIAGISENKQAVNLTKDTAVGTNAEYQISVVNNTGNKINNVKILGYFPTKGEIQQGKENITNTLETSVVKGINGGNAQVYYSENSNVTADLSNTSNGWTQDTSKIANAKTYLIDLGNMEIGAKFTTGYTSKIANELDYDLASYAGYKVLYNDEGSKQEQTVESTLVGMTTEGGIKVEDIKLETEVEATVGDNILKDGDTVKAGEVIKYKITSKNVGERKLKDITIKGIVPEGTVYVEPETDFEYTGNSYYSEKPEIKEVAKTIESLESGAEYTLEYEVRVNMNVTNGTKISNKGVVSCGEYSTNSNEINNTISEGKIRITLKNLYGNDNIAAIGDNEFYIVFIENLSEQDVSLKNVQLLLSGQSFVKATEGENELKYNEQEKTLDIGTIPAKTTKGFKVMTEITENSKEATISAIATDAEGNSYRSNTSLRKVTESKADITLTTPNNGGHVNTGDEVIYNLTIKNISKISQSLTVIDNIPEELEINQIIVDDKVQMQTLNYEDEETFVSKISNNFEYVLTADAEQEIKMTIKTIVKYKNDNPEAKTITNSAKISIEGQVKGTSSEVTHIINGKITEDMKNIISGIAWLDKNQNGQKDTDETVLQDITVRLLDTKTNKIATNKDGETLETKTDEKGTYTFSKVNQGQYIVIFEYDTTKYEPTSYKKEGVSEGLNSSAVAKTTTIDGQVKGNAATDTIDLEESIFNINIGLKENLKYDLELGKYISKIVVQNKKGTKSYEYNNDETFQKIEIHSKQIEGSVVVLEYTIRVKNTGEIAGYVTNIRDYLPNGLTFSSELNPDWYLSGQDLYTKNLANARIEPGEIKEVKLILTKTMTSNNVGLINNRAEIAESYNEYGKLDIDSTENNQANGEDDIGSADVIIGVSTGMKMVAYTILIMINTALIAFVLYLIFRKKNRTK